MGKVKEQEHRPNTCHDMPGPSRTQSIMLLLYRYQAYPPITKTQSWKEEPNLPIFQNALHDCEIENGENLWGRGVCVGRVESTEYKELRSYIWETKHLCCETISQMSGFTFCRPGKSCCRLFFSASLFFFSLFVCVRVNFESRSDNPLQSLFIIPNVQH